jgi:putative tricarboxylic transport membrane protein
MIPSRRFGAALPELVAGTFSLVLAGLFIAQARGLPPPYFEPIGSAAVPRGTAWIVVVLAIVMMARALFSQQSGPAAFHSPHEVRRTLAFSGLILLYVAALGLTRIGYAVATIVFLTMAVPLLAGFSRQWLLRSLALGILLGFGLQYLFTHILVTDLP